MKFSDFKNSEEAAKPHYLLIGNPVGHSVSPLMHNTALQHHGIDAKYYAVEVQENDLSSLVSHLNSEQFLGANITIPHKLTFLEVVDGLSEEAEHIGAVNTLVKKDGRLLGHNTDSYGFMVPLEEFEGDLESERAIIFGTGGATKAIIYSLQLMGFEEILMVSRKPETLQPQNGVTLCSYDSWIEYAEEANLIINATPLGMLPNIETSPVDEGYADLLNGKVCYDIVYNPRETRFLSQAEQNGGIPVGGLDMLIYQGARAFKLWTGKEFPIGLVKMKLDELFPN